MAAETKRRAKIIDVNDHTITLQITGDCSDSCQGCRLQIVCHNTSGADSLHTVARDCYAGVLGKGDTVEISAAGSSQLTAGTPRRRIRRRSICSGGCGSCGGMVLCRCGIEKKV